MKWDIKITSAKITLKLILMTLYCFIANNLFIGNHFQFFNDLLADVLTSYNINILYIFLIVSHKHMYRQYKLCNGLEIRHGKADWVTMVCIF